MTKTKNTKRALLSSVLALVVCIAMLVGSTFAWFTDNATTSGNSIVSGKLDVALEMEENGAWVNAEGKTLKWITEDQVDNVLWEPGCTYKLPKLRVVNKGNLALKYTVAITGLTGDVKLLEAIDFTGIPAEGQYVELKKQNDAVEFQIEGHMKEDAGNEYMGLTLSGISITVYATQLNYENDSYGPDYDKLASFSVKTADDLANLLAMGGKITLENDVATDKTLSIPAGVIVELDLNGKTITGTMHKNDGAVIANNGTAIITNGKVSSTANNGGSAIKNAGTLTIESVTLNGAPNANGSWPSYTVNNTGVMEINDSYITSKHGAVASYNDGAIVTLNNTDINMSGIPGFTNHGIYTYNNGAAVVNGGNIANNATDQNSTGGSVINGNVTVNSGTITGRIETYSGTPVIKGGTFTANPTAYVAAGYVATKNADDTWTVAIPKASTNAELSDAFTNGGLIEADGKFAVEDFNNGVREELTVVGGTLSRDSGNGNPLTVYTTEKVTFEKVNFETVKGGAVLSTRKEGANIEVNDCTFTNFASPSTGNVGVQVFASNVTITFNNCTFNNMPIETNSSYKENIKMVFNNCTFNWTGDNCPGMIKLANYVEADIDINDSVFTYTTNSQYTTTKNMISYYSSVGTSTIDFNNFKVIGNRNNNNIWKICASSKNATVNATGELSYTFNGEAIDFNTYLK